MKLNFWPTRTGLLLLLVGAIGLAALAGCQTPASHPQAASFRVMTYNIHHGEGLDGKVDLARLAALIQRERADIVALQEVDKGVQRTERRDLPAELAKLTGMTCLFSNNFSFQGGEYGNALLTRFPVQSWTNTLLARSSPGEQRGILQATLRVQDRPLVVLATHLDNHSESERLQSAGQIQQLVQAYRCAPLLLCGDFNTRPDSSTYQKLAEGFTDSWLLAGEGAGPTIPADQPRQRIDYIWLSPANALVVRRAWVPPSDASDHRPVVVECQFR